MSLVTPTPTPPPADQQAAARLRAIAQEIHDFVLPRWQQGRNLVWSNPRLQPLAALQAMGADALTLAESSALLAQLLALNGETLPATPPNGHTLNFNQDGSIASIT